MSAYYLSKRREEEEAQRRAVQEQVAAKNDALRAKEAQQREQAKIQNYLQGKAMLEAALKDSNLSDSEKAAIRAQAQSSGMAAGLGATAAAVTAQQTRRESELAWLLQADKSESQRLAEYQKTPEYQAREQERLAILNWIKTGENPPPSMMDKTEDERLAMFKDTHAYQSQQASLAAWQAEQERKAQIFLDLPFPVIHYYQNQGMVPVTGDVECVTTSVVIARNMMKDILVEQHSLNDIPDLTVVDYAKTLDMLGMGGWINRFPTDFPNVPIVDVSISGWMHPVLQAPTALNNLSIELQKQLGHGFSVEQTSGNSLDDITEHLKKGNPVIVHGLWEVTNPNSDLYKLGGAPHTMLVIGTNSYTHTVTLLDPAYPSVATPSNPVVPSLHEMSEKDFLDWWSRQSIGNAYTAPNTMTILTP